MNDMLWFVSRTISDGPMISGTSIYKDKLGQQIASPLLTLHSRPVSDEICYGYFVTSDGYAAQNSTIVESGVLKTYLLSLYGSRKTGFDRAVNMGGAFVMEPGDTSLDDMIKSVEKGILLARFSGGYPSDSGDFSGWPEQHLIEAADQVSVKRVIVSGNFGNVKNIAISEEDRNCRNSVQDRIASGCQAGHAMAGGTTDIHQAGTLQSRLSRSPSCKAARNTATEVDHSIFDARRWM